MNIMMYTQLKKTTEISAGKVANWKGIRQRITNYFKPGVSIHIDGITFCDSTRMLISP